MNHCCKCKKTESKKLPLRFYDHQKQRNPRFICSPCGKLKDIKNRESRKARKMGLK
jgi:hypothetical protein